MNHRWFGRVTDGVPCAIGLFFAVAAIWGFIDGNDVVGLVVADTTNNITHAILAALGLVTGLMPRSAYAVDLSDVFGGQQHGPVVDFDVP